VFFCVLLWLSSVGSSDSDRDLATDEHRYTQIRTGWRAGLGHLQIDHHDRLARLPATMFILFLEI
jgi:hypothetical protein